MFVQGAHGRLKVIVRKCLNARCVNRPAQICEENCIEKLVLFPTIYHFFIPMLIHASTVLLLYKYYEYLFYGLLFLHMTFPNIGHAINVQDNTNDKKMQKDSNWA